MFVYCLCIHIKQEIPLYSSYIAHFLSEQMHQKLQANNKFNTFYQAGTCILTLFYIFNVLLVFPNI